MRSKNVFWGVVLVSIGILFVLRNMGVIYFTWGSIFSLWPVFLIVLGISLLPIKGLVRILLAFLIIIFSLVFISNTNYYNRYQYFEPHNWFRWDNDEYSNRDEEENYEWRDQQLFEEYDSEITNAVLDLDAIAGEFVISETSDYLLKFDRQGNFGKYYLRADNAGSAVVLKIDMDSYIEDGPKLKNEARISLHPNPVWDLKVDAGASKLDFDLSPYKIDRLDLDGGASSISLKLGDRFDNTEVSINSGAASTFIEVPHSVGCRVETNTVLSSKTLDDFDKLENGNYQTENFKTADHKIIIKVDAALSSLKVVRY